MTLPWLPHDSASVAWNAGKAKAGTGHRDIVTLLLKARRRGLDAGVMPLHQTNRIARTAAYGPFLIPSVAALPANL